MALKLQQNTLLQDHSYRIIESKGRLRGGGQALTACSSPMKKITSPQTQEACLSQGMGGKKGSGLHPNLLDFTPNGKWAQGLLSMAPD